MNGAVGGPELPDVVTDAQGRYTVTGIAGPLIFLQTDPSSDYRSLCDSYPITLDFHFKDLPVVHRSWSGNRLPPGMWIIGTSVSGTVSERTNEGLQPLAGATVTFDTGNQDPPATTTDSGFYMICSVVGTDQTRSISAQKSGYYPAVRQNFGGWDFDAHFELTRR